MSDKEKKDYKFDTKIIHSGINADPATGSIIPPITQTATYVLDGIGESKGYDYTRSANPTREILENNLASLENGKYGISFSSGMAAIDSFFRLFESGSHIICSDDVYGGVTRLLDQVLSKYQVEVTYVNVSDISEVEKNIKPNTKLIWIESPTNPLLKIIDIQAISEYSKKINASVLVDNTFASSYFQKPLDLGADISLSSSTKYLNGHSDCLGGVVCTNDSEWNNKMIFAQKALGLQPSPFDSWLIKRGIKTLSLRMKQHEFNALAIAKFFEEKVKTELIRYPFLESDPGYENAKKQMTGGSGIVTVDLGLDLDETVNFINKLDLFTPAESLGGIESLVCHPASMTHASIPSDIKLETGITDSLVRLSVGVESIDDLINDVLNALPKIVLK
ncbi:UNVERIFIED_CONTAM: hypothetical protein GTU68_039199 [Idotea baltica]|nr:hypothetical protein [Idotea baltica]